MKKTLLSLMLSICMIICMIPVTAAEVHAVTFPIDVYANPEGVLVDNGDNLINYSFDTATKTLTLSGTGYLPDYSYPSTSHPFHQQEIKNLVVEEGIISIGTYLMYQCTGLESVSLPQSLTSYGRFSSGTNILYETPCGNGGFKVDEDNEYYTSLDGCLFNKEMTELLYFGGPKKDYTVPKSVKKIKTGAFTGIELDALTLQGTDLVIGNYATESSTKVGKLVIGDGIKELGDYSRITLTEDTSITLPASYIGSIDQQGLLNSKTIENIYVDEKNPVYASVDGILLEKETGYVLVYPQGKQDENYVTNPAIKGFRCNCFGINQTNKYLKNLVLGPNVEYLEPITGWGYGPLNIGEKLESITVENKNLEFPEKAFSKSNLPEKIYGFEGSKVIDFAIKYGGDFYSYRGTIDYDTSVVEGLADKYKYTGSEIRPIPVIKYRGVVELVEGRDYTLEYQNNIERGTGYIKVTGIGDYMTDGTFDIAFDIVDCIHENRTKEVIVEGDCNTDSFVEYTCLDCGHTWTASVFESHNLVHHEKKDATCTEDGWYAYDECTKCDYTTYFKIPKKTHELKNHSSKAPTCTEPGWNEYNECINCDYTEKVEIPALGHTYDSTVSKAAPGKDGFVLNKCFCGETNVEQISRPEKVTLSNSTYAYDGTAKNPTVTVKDAEGKTLVKDTDYTVTVPSGRTKAGTYTYTVNFIGNYEGTMSADLVIEPGSVSASNASLSFTKATYDGTVKSPTVTVKDAKGNTLVKDTDYTVTIPEGRKAAGTYTYVVKLTGNYEGTISLDFVIEPVSINGKKAKLSFTKVKYSGKANKPSVTISGLKKGTDFTVSYLKNTKVGKATVKITGKGNYNGTLKKTFKINPKKPVISKLTSGKGKATVKMSTKVSSTGGTTYQISYRVKGTKTWKKTTTTSQTKTIKSLKKGKKYEVKVRAYKTVNKVKYYGEYSKLKTSAAVK